MKFSIPQVGLLLLIAVVTTAFIVHRSRPVQLETGDDTSSAFQDQVRAIQQRLAKAEEQREIVARLEENYYHITYDYLSTPSSDPTPAVQRLVDQFGRDFVGEPYYLGNSVSLKDVDLISRLPSLQIVDFDDTSVTDQELVHLKSLPRLRVLFLNST